jgi:phosphatidylglycerol---prolipoprotein diacylglyceryl transferase
MFHSKFFYFLFLVLFFGFSFLIWLFFIPAFKGDIIVSSHLALGLFSIRWYGLIMAASVLVGLVIARKFAHLFGIEKKELPDFIFWLVIVSGIGARLFFVIMEFSYFAGNPGEIFKIWNGGISIYGAIISAFLFTYFYSRNKTYFSWQLLDLVALSFPLAQALGRFGNFFNQEAYGSETNLPWKMFVSETGLYHHPTFLYEAIWNVLVFIGIYNMLGRFKGGVVMFGYLGLYSIGRFFIEALRVDTVFWGSFPINQTVALVVFMFSAIMIWKLEKRAEK